MQRPIKLVRRYVEKPWGCADLPVAFGARSGVVGEIWFEMPNGEPLSLLPKYLFTSEQLSVQVHPDDAAARSAGAASGKTECWYVVGAEPGASVAMGLKKRLSTAQARQAALDGSIEDLLCWWPVEAGDFIFVPAGTIHAIGAGVSIIEVQQNSDVTYRMFDYGRPRTLHLDDALEVADLGPAHSSLHQRGSREARVLISAAQFTVALISAKEGQAWLQDRQRWILPVAESARAGEQEAGVGECLLVAAGHQIELSAGGMALIAAEGPLEPDVVRVTAQPDFSRCAIADK